ncbi:cell envelope integrity protein TolA [Aliivibrio salmonicida]|uniref:TolA protein, membrane component n=1 Tax=Aliivibrio salmonicida (strain LFI1238) TaxID=316275 RepID=B6EGK2_ALISL|nr:cell envelope integrity protein TolA [Aliivibrio salmonicida]AZL85101.1 cell envelope integrity protein TolA [Aliivibrio salmonicida]CAQ79582.1 TolA protein, membrane component [Aliivibrio salmonicida LFI1238]
MKSDNNYTFAIVVSVVLHLLLAVALIFGSDFSMDEKAKPNTIQAVVIDPSTIARQASQIRQEREKASRAETERLNRLKQQADQLEKNRKVEENRIRKLKEQQVKEKKAARRAEDERKKAVAQAKKEKERATAAEADRKRKVDTAAKAEAARLTKVKADKEKAEKARLDKERATKAEAERVAKEKIAKEKAAKAKAKLAAENAKKEKARAAKAEAARKQKEAALNDIFAGLEDETVQNSSAKQQHIDDEVNRYAAIFTQRIQRNLLVDESYVGKSCKVKIKLASSGLLLSVTTLGGDAQVCRAAKIAVTKVNVFQMPKDADIVAKLTNINLTVQPE